MKVYTVKAVKARVRNLRKSLEDRHDSESAPADEDQLYLDVLRAIAAGEAEDPAAMATEALKTQDWNFSRWCA